MRQGREEPVLQPDTELVTAGVTRDGTLSFEGLSSERSKKLFPGGKNHRQAPVSH